MTKFNSLKVSNPCSKGGKRKRLRWANRSKNFIMLHDLMMDIYPKYQNDESYWNIFEEIEDYFLDLEENRETDNGDKENIL